MHRRSRKTLPFIDGIATIHSKKPVRLPVVLSQNEVVRLLGEIKDETALMARLMYGGGLRLKEGVANAWQPGASA